VCNQWRIYIEAKEAVLGGPRSKGAAPNYLKIQLIYGEKYKILGPLVKKEIGLWGGWGPTISVAWGLTRPKSGPVCNNLICSV